MPILVLVCTDASSRENRGVAAIMGKVEVLVISLSIGISTSIGISICTSIVLVLVLVLIVIAAVSGLAVLGCRASAPLGCRAPSSRDSGAARGCPIGKLMAWHPFHSG